MDALSASSPMALWRLVLQPYHSCLRAPVFKAAQRWSVTQPITAVCLLLSPHPPPPNLLLAHAPHIFSLAFILLSSLSFAPAPLSLPSLSPLECTFSLSPVYHQSWISSLHFPPLFFTSCHNPLSPLLPPLTQPICLFTFWQT